jgi:hypothetical protein
MSNLKFCLDAIIGKIGKNCIEIIAGNMRDNVLKKKSIFHSKLCLEEDYLKYLENLKECKNQELERDMERKKYASKQIKNHTPYCYEYHTYFFKSGEECKNVKFYEGRNFKEKEEDRLCNKTFVEINLKDQNKKTISHLMETKLPEIWGLSISHIELFRDNLTFESNMEMFFDDVFPEKLNQLSLEAEPNNFLPRFSSNNIKQLCKILKTKRIAEIFTLSGFQMTDSQFNTILDHVGNLEELHIKNCDIISAHQNEDSEKPIAINVLPITTSRRLKKINFKDNSWSEEVKLQIYETIQSSKLMKQLTEFELIPEKE